MKWLLLIGWTITFIPSRSQTVTHGIKDPASRVNPLMGSDSKPSLSNGNTYPVIGMPWGMNYWCPQTNTMGSGWQYQYGADRIRGFKQTHQPSPWMNDYGQFSIMPVTGHLRFRENERASWFSHKTEIVHPYYYQVYLSDADVTTELAPAERAAKFRFHFPKTDSAFLVIDAFDKGSYIKILPEQRKIIGYSVRNSGGVPANFRNYFVMEFSAPFTFSAAWHDSVLVNGQLEVKADHAGAVLGFASPQGSTVEVSVASSFISEEQAQLNLDREIGKAAFETIRQRAQDRWNELLGRIELEGGTVGQTQTFYSCLYRTLLFPQKHYEWNKANQAVHYSPYNGKTLPGYLYAGTGFWDTFRALYPFLSLMYPSVNREMQEGLINDYKEGGWLPEWSSPGYRNVMVGNNSAAVVADAYVKGIRGYDIQTLYEALLHGANNEGPIDALGRKGVNYYNDLGYVPYDVHINENAARTLEYAFDDFAIYQLAKMLKRPQAEIDLYARRCLNYRNLFDAETRLMRGKNQNGEFMKPFNPFKWGDAFTEGNSWHYSWSVFHDIAGLMDLMGGRQAFAGMLDSVFKMPPVFDESYYGYVIHEIREMQIMNMGQYAHGNQPIQHMIFLYDYAGQPWKAQYWSREAMDKLYHSTPDGYCGDEDNGQTSAWYVFAAMGFYPVCPATDQYALGSPLFSKISLHLENGKTFVISAGNNSPSRRYIKDVRLNNQLYSKNWLNHFDILKGGELHFTMSASANYQRGISENDEPFSFSREIGAK